MYFVYDKNNFNILKKVEKELDQAQTYKHKKDF
jgi:hypothetical protein